jgi:hypothetical protein
MSSKKGKRGKSGGFVFGHGRLVPAIPIVRALSPPDRDRGDKPGDDELAAASFAPLLKNQAAGQCSLKLRRSEMEIAAAGGHNLLMVSRQVEEPVLHDKRPSWEPLKPRHGAGGCRSS